MKRSDFLKSGLAMLTGGIWSRYFNPDQFSNKSSREFNVIFILTDDLGYHDLGCCGQKDIRTPSPYWHIVS